MKSKMKSITTLEFIDLCFADKILESIGDVYALELSSIELLNVFKKAFNTSNKSEVETHFSSSINRDWIESKFTNFDLFSQNEIIFIYDCEGIAIDNLKLLEELALSSDRRVLLFFNKDIQKKWKSSGLKVKKPAFWEGGKVFSALSEFYGVELSREAIDVASKHLDSNVNDAFSLVETLKSFVGSKVEVNQMESLIPHTPTSQFDLVEYLNNKNIKSFYEKLSSVHSYDELSQLVSFCIGHLLKFIGPHGDEMKKNKYNRQIVEASKKWNEKEVSSLIGNLKDILFDSRSRNKKAFINTMKASLKRN
jgi:hypothetical protein